MREYNKLFFVTQLGILEQCFADFFLAYHIHNTKHVRVNLGTANINVYLQDNGLPGCSARWPVLGLQTYQPAKQQIRGNPKLRSCYFSNSTPLDDRAQSVFTFEQWSSTPVFVYTSKQFFYTLLHIWNNRKGAIKVSKKVMVKWSRYRSGVVQREGRGIDPSSMTAALEGGEWSAARPGRTLLPGKTRYPGPVWTGGKSRPHRDSIPDRPVRSQSLYWLSYPAHN